MSKQSETKSFYGIYTFLARVNSSFAHVFSLSLKGRLNKLEFKSVQLVSFSTPTDANTPKPFPTATSIIPLKPAQFSPEEEAIDDFFNDIQFEPVKNELHKWFFFGLAGDGQQIANLTPQQVACFKNELPQLISALYNYHRFRRKEAHDEG